MCKLTVTSKDVLPVFVTVLSAFCDMLPLFSHVYEATIVQGSRTPLLGEAFDQSSIQTVFSLK